MKISKKKLNNIIAEEAEKVKKGEALNETGGAIAFVVTMITYVIGLYGLRTFLVAVDQKLGTNLSDQDLTVQGFGEWNPTDPTALPGFLYRDEEKVEKAQAKQTKTRAQSKLDALEKFRQMQAEKGFKE